jgi:glycosyltransferase involved in cell wall biosynthesis
MKRSSGSISVALCTHNGARYLREQLESILDQTLPPTEIVLSDDASTDATVELARSIVAERGDRAPAFVVLENDPALGVAANFERAVLACSGEIIALSDQDDLWAPERLAVMSAAFEDRPELLLLHTDALLVDADNEPIGGTLFAALAVTAREKQLVHSRRAFEALLRRNLVTGATTLFRRSLVGTATPFPRGWVHDEWLAMVAASLDGVDLLDEPLVRYRQHGANQIGATKLSLRGKIGRMTEPRAARNERLLRNSAVLVRRLDELQARGELLRLARGKLSHERTRSSLSAVRILRIAPIVAGLVAGRYGRYSRGPMDALRDLVQPAG